MHKSPFSGVGHFLIANDVMTPLRSSVEVNEAMHHHVVDPRPSARFRADEEGVKTSLEFSISNSEMIFAPSRPERSRRTR